MTDEKLGTEIKKEEGNYTALIFSVVALAIACFTLGFQLGKLL